MEGGAVLRGIWSGAAILLPLQITGPDLWETESNHVGEMLPWLDHLTLTLHIFKKIIWNSMLFYHYFVHEQSYKMSYLRHYQIIMQDFIPFFQKLYNWSNRGHRCLDRTSWFPWLDQLFYNLTIYYNLKI